MPETTSQLPPEPSFEETTFFRASQLLADPLTDSTRKRQSLLLLLSILSLAVFFGIVAPEKVSLGGVDMKLVAPLTPSGTVSTSLRSIAINALSFNKVLCPVLVYAVLAFWLSVYRDHKAAKYLRELAAFDIRRAANQQYADVKVKTKELNSVRERFQNLNAKRFESSKLIQGKLKEIGDEFKRKIGPIQGSHVAAFAEFEKLRKEGSPRNPELEVKLGDLGERISELGRQHDDDLRPLEDEYAAVMGDPEIREVEKRLDCLTDEIFRLRDTLTKRNSILDEVNVVVRRWRMLWYLLEVGFPSILGLVAISVPIWTF
jgi:hypothetical protein